MGYLNARIDANMRVGEYNYDARLKRSIKLSFHKNKGYE